jgi:hypothetical protein
MCEVSSAYPFTVEALTVFRNRKELQIVLLSILVIATFVTLFYFWFFTSCFDPHVPSSGDVFYLFFYALLASLPN